MSEWGTLLGVGQIAIAIAGFSAIVVIFKRSEAGKWRAVDADRFHGMLLHAMSAAFFCIAPPLVAVFTPEARSIWAIASAALGLQILAHVVLILRLPSTGGGARGVALLGFAAALLQALNVLEIGFAREFRPYLAGVLWHVLLAGLLFVNLVWVRAADVEDR